MSRSLDCVSDFALMERTGSCDAARNDLATLGDEFGSISAEDHLFVIDRDCFFRVLRFFDAERTDFSSRFSILIVRLIARATGCGCHW